MDCNILIERRAFGVRWSFVCLVLTLAMVPCGRARGGVALAPADTVSGYAARLLINEAYAELREHLFRTRYLAPFPESELLERMRSGVRAQVLKETPNRRVDPGPQVVYLAPMSPVANEV